MSNSDKSLIDAREWQAQERGLDAALGRNPGSMDAAAANYQAVAEAVMSMPLAVPPLDFATSVVLRIAQQDAALERILSRILLGVFVAASIIMGVCYGEQWWQSLHLSLGNDTLQWILVGAGSVALSWLCSQLLELAGCFRGVEAAPPGV